VGLNSIGMRPKKIMQRLHKQYATIPRKINKEIKQISYCLDLRNNKCCNIPKLLFRFSDLHLVLK